MPPSLSPPTLAYYSLEVVLDRLMNRQEKHWGCFQIHKIDRNLYQLKIDQQPPLNLQQGTDGYSYKAWWGNQNVPAVVVRKRPRKVTIAPANPGASLRGSTSRRETLNLPQNPSHSPRRPAPGPQTPTLVTQQTYEVQWRVDLRSGSRVVNQLLAQAVYHTIERRIAELPDPDPGDLKPVVSLVQVD